ncbi:MAG TPA: CesT family type III secretion system chaperone [Usitatibacter sp.]|nr:CesT family type III secretion system chaperone [Usitatibacter sp.]
MNLPMAMVDYMKAGGLGEEALRSGGELPLVFDDTLRVRLVPLADGTIVLESRVRPMPEGAAERERLVERALKLSFGRMQDHADTLTLSEDRQALRLQSRLPADASRMDLETRLEAHLNALAFWRDALA